jgi:predicted RNA-binding Zn-ribbon protein involved in translation (DUF1610 family)
MTRKRKQYVCPNCGRESTDPKVCAVTPAGPDAETEYHCPCGNVYTQATARKVTFKDRT